MTASTLVVAVTAPKESSKASIAAMARASQHLDLDIVEIAPDKSPTTGTASTSMQYHRQIPLSTFSDRLINLVATDGGRGSSIRRPWLAGSVGASARPPRDLSVQFGRSRPQRSVAAWSPNSRR